jgi:hypothetical protein
MIMNYWKVIDDPGSEWDGLVETCTNSDVYHHAGYVAAMKREGKDQPKLLVFQCENGIVIHPLIFRSLDVIGTNFAGFFDVTSCYGYGGPAWNAVTGEDCILLKEFWSEEVTFLSSLSVVTEFVRVHPLIPSCEVLAGQPSLVDRSQTTAIDLTRALKELWAGLSTNHRRNISTARKEGIIVQFYDRPDSHLIEEFATLYTLTMDRLEACPEYYFPKRRFLDLFNKLSPGMAWLAVAVHKGTIIAAFINLSSDSISHYHLGAYRNSARNLGANHLLMFESVLFSKERECRKMHLGGGYNDGDGLLRFKTGFGGKLYGFQTLDRIILPGVYAEICKHVGIENPSLSSYFPAYRTPRDTSCEAIELAKERSFI